MFSGEIVIISFVWGVKLQGAGTMRIRGLYFCTQIEYISEEFALSRPNPYLCCQKEEEAGRKATLSVGTTVL